MSIYIGPPAHESGGGNVTPFAQTIHATCPGLGYPSASRAGRAVETAHYFQNPSSGGSAHVVCDVSTSVRCAPDDMVCWHAPPNSRTIGYEICGESTYARDQWLSPEVWPAVARVAAEVKADAIRYGIPIHRCTVDEVRANHGGQRGHVDVSNAFHQSDHTDPGYGFPWDRFMLLLGGSSPAPASVSPMGLYHPETIPLQIWEQGSHTALMQRTIGVTPSDGYFGPGTLAALKRFQASHGLVADGIAGPLTAAALYPPHAPAPAPHPAAPPAPSVAFLAQFAGVPAVWEVRHITRAEWNARRLQQSAITVLADAKALAARPEATR